MPYGERNLLDNAFTANPATEQPRWLNREFVSQFAQDFEYAGRIEPEQFQRNLCRLRARISGRFILLKGVELPHASDPDGSLLERHRIMNRAVDEFVRSTENCSLLDVRRIVDRPEHLADSLRHYRREAYARMSGELVCLLSSDSGEPLRTNRLRQVGRSVHRRLGRLKLRWRRWAAV